MEWVLVWVAVGVAVAGIGWAVLNEVVYRLARMARRGWEDEGDELRRQRDAVTAEGSGRR